MAAARSRRQNDLLTMRCSRTGKRTARRAHACPDGALRTRGWPHRLKRKVSEYCMVPLYRLSRVWPKSLKMVVDGLSR